MAPDSMPAGKSSHYPFRDLLIGLLLSYSAFALWATIESGDVFMLGKAALFAAFAAIGPVISLLSAPHMLAVIGIVLCGLWAISLPQVHWLLRIGIATFLFLIWGYFGAIGFSLSVGGA